MGVLCRIPLVADPTKEISADYGVLIPSLGIALRGLFIINPEGILEQVTLEKIKPQNTEGMLFYLKCVSEGVSEGLCPFHTVRV